MQCLAKIHTWSLFQMLTTLNALFIPIHLIDMMPIGISNQAIFKKLVTWLRPVNTCVLTNSSSSSVGFSHSGLVKLCSSLKKFEKLISNFSWKTTIHCDTCNSDSEFSHYPHEERIICHFTQAKMQANSWTWAMGRAELKCNHNLMSAQKFFTWSHPCIFCD